MEMTDVINDTLDELESIYNQLAQASCEREFLTDDEHTFIYAEINRITTPLGATAISVIPSLESDNFFERNSITASMEGIGEAIKDGAKAFFKRIFEMLKGVFTRIAERYKGLTAKLAKLRQKADVVNKTVERTKAQKAPAQATEDQAPEGQKAPLVTKFQIDMTILKIDGVADKVNSAESMNSYISKLTGHLSNLIRDFSARMDFGPDTNNFDVDSMKALQNLEVDNTPSQYVIDVSRELPAWERWTKTTLPFVGRVFENIAKKQIQTKMQEHLTAAERAVNTEKDEAKLNGYRQRINGLGKMIKTFDMLLAAITSIDIKPMSTPPPIPSSTTSTPPASTPTT